MENLKKCPFCGSDAILETSKFGYRVSCKQRALCGATQVFSDSEEEAIIAWNTRKPMERIAEWLEEHYKEAHRDAEKYKGKIAFGMYLAFKDAIKIVKEETDHEESDIISGTTSGS